MLGAVCKARICTPRLQVCAARDSSVRQVRSPATDSAAMARAVVTVVKGRGPSGHYQDHRDWHHHASERASE